MKRGNIMANNVRTALIDVIRGVRMNHKVLFWGGILSPAIYLLTIVLGGIITPNYSHIRNAISELTQRGAPNIIILSTLFVLSAILILIFAIALMLRYRCRSKRVYAGGVLILLYGVFATLMATIFPQDPLGEEATLPGTMHLMMAGLAAFAIMGSILLIGLGMHPLGKHWNHFRLYSVITVLLVFIFGISTPILIANQIEVLGTFERLTQLAYLQWFVVLAVKSYKE